MPLYTYVDHVSGVEVDVIRRVSETELLPTAEEAGMTEEQWAQATWERLVGSGITVHRAPGFGSKGSW